MKKQYIMNRITVETSMQADISTVWDCWTLPEHIVNWNFATDTWHCPHVVNDLRPGGQFSWRMEAKDGSMGFDFEGTYDTVEDMAHLSYTMSDGRRVDIRFRQEGDLVTLTETFDAEGPHADEQQRAGGQAILEDFMKYVEAR